MAILNAARRPVTINQIAAALEVSAKTAQRAVLFMREELALPIRANEQGHYFAHSPVKVCACCCALLS